MAGYVPAYANNTSHNCDVYATGPIWKSRANFTFSYSCQDIADGYNIPLDSLKSWNPSLSDNTEDCQLSSGLQYCVQKQRIVPDKVTDACVHFEIAQPGSDCEGFSQSFGVNNGTFVEWNGSDCESFRTGT